MQEELIMRKISEGDTGAMAAAKIFKNDTLLMNAIKALQDYLDAYGALINIEVPGGNIDLVQWSGDSTTSVVSQKGVTDLVVQSTANGCKIGETVSAGIQMPPTGNFADVWVSRASANAEGHSLTILYNDVEELKRTNATTIASLQEAINNLSSRVTRLEAIVNGY